MKNENIEIEKVEEEKKVEEVKSKVKKKLVDKNACEVCEVGKDVALFLQAVQKKLIWALWAFIAFGVLLLIFIVVVYMVSVRPVLQQTAETMSNIGVAAENLNEIVAPVVEDIRGVVQDAKSTISDVDGLEKTIDNLSGEVVKPVRTLNKMLEDLPL